MQCTVGFIALELIQIALRVVHDARNQLNLVRQLDDVVVCSGAECRALHFGTVFGRHHNNGNVFREKVAAIPANEAQPVDTRHHQVLQDHRRPNTLGNRDSLLWIGAIVERNVGFVRERASDSLADHRLIVHQQDHDLSVRAEFSSNFEIF